MKNAIAILVSFLLLGTGLQVSIDRHYCSGEIADVKVSITGKLASCGMEEDQAVPFTYPVMNTKCCEDEIIFYSISSNFYPEYKNTFTNDKGKIINQVPAYNIDSYNIPEYSLIKFIVSSGNKSGPSLKQSEICVFRI